MDWFSEVDKEAVSGWNTEELSRIDGSKCDLFINVDLDSDAAKPNEIAAQVGAGNLMPKYTIPVVPSI